jgi:hypothetical protein
MIRLRYPVTLFLLFFTLIALEQGCGRTPGPETRAPERTKERPTTQSNAVAEITPEFLQGDEEAGRDRELSLEAIQKKLLPESFLGPPEKDRASPGTKYDTFISARTLAAPPRPGWRYRQNQQGKVVGFEFSNRGGNPILPPRYNIDKNLFFSRDFQFRFDDRARQDIHLYVSDWIPSRDRQFRLSELMNSVLYFFPRNYLPAIASLGERTLVKLPTGEEVEFNADTYEILGGVFAEAPVDFNPDRSARKFAGLRYTGRGVVVRADAQGADPRLGTTATVTAAAPASECGEANCPSQCRVPSKELWDQKGAVRFKFSTDEEFDRYLLARCGFGLPQNDPRFVIALTLN